MKGSRFLKAAAALAVLAALGAGAAFVAVKVYFPEPRARAWVVDAARKQLGRDVRLARIDVGLRGLSLVGLEVSEKPDFSAGTFLKVADFRLRPSWKALIKRKLVVAAVSADGLQVQVLQGKDGRFNYESLTSSAATASMAAAPPARTDEAAPQLDVRHASVTNGALEYRGADGSAWALSGVSLELTDFSQAEPFGLETAFRVRGAAGGRPVDAQVSFEGLIDLARGSHEKFKAAIKKLVVEQEGLRLTATGQEDGLDAPDVALDASLAASGKELLSVGGRLKLGRAASADLKWKTRALDTSLIARFAPRWGIPALELPPAEGALVATYEPGAADVKAFSASWAGSRIQAAGSARGLGGAKPVYEGRATFGLDLPARKPGAYPFLKLPPALSLPAARLDGEVVLKDGVLKIVSLKTKTAQGVVSLDGSVKGALSAKPVPDVTAVLALDLPAFKVSDLPVALTGVPGSFAVPAGRLEGTVRASGEDVSLKGVAFKARGASIGVDGTVRKALAGAPVPDVAVTADLVLPALTDRDLPFPGVPAGLKMPPSHWAAALDYSPRLIKLKSLRVRTGKNDLEASGSVTDPSGRAAFDLLFKCRSFALEELTQLTPRTRDLKLAGSGYFALSVTGTEEKPIFGGKLQFNGLGATVADLPLSGFTGTASFDPERIDVPNLTGRFGDGKLSMDLTVKDYARSPEIDLEAQLDRFDLGKYLAAKAAIAKEQSAAGAAQAAKSGKPAEARGPSAPFATRGHLNVGTLFHPNALVNDVKIGWDLRGVTPDMRRLTGDAKLHVGAGKLIRLGDAVLPKTVKVLLFPVLIVQRIRGADLNDMALNQIVGDYGFKDGLMTLRQSGLDTDAMHVTETGTIDLPAELLDLVVTTQFGNIVPVDTAVTGTFDQPKTKVRIAKALLGDPAKNLIQGLLNR
ncbi:MAG TPA: AsmA-like C-terminal region-containing protein [Elusimicrobiota bacterium]|nr:AsmA-like C-terminal region-containing protein [Elusimicrobiota bacterium]